MNFPLFPHEAFGYPTSAALAGVVGFGFGFILERSGFGRATVLAAQFYFKDMRVLKVMFSAIATALLGMAILDGAGLLEMGAITVPQSFLWPQIVGGLLLGVGFVVSGYCPGTSIVATASGNLDGPVALLGIVTGSLAFGFAYPLLESFYLSTPLEQVRFPELLGVSHGILAAAVLAMAVGAFLGAEKLEAFMARRSKEEPPPSSPRLRNAVFVGLGALAVVAIALVPFDSGEAAAQGQKPYTAIQPLDLAQQLITEPERLMVFDLRSKDACSNKTIPGATCRSEADFTKDFVATQLPAARHVVLLNGAEIKALPGSLNNFPGRVSVLQGGYAAFDSQVLKPPAVPASPDRQSLEEYRLRSALHAHFTGSRVQAKPVELAPRKVTRQIKKGGGC